MRVLITAGQVYGKLDANKLVGNRVRGIWAMKFARWLADRGHKVTLLVPTTMVLPLVKDGVGEAAPGATGTIIVTKHDGFDHYLRKCQEFATTHDAAVMAAAVVNWIPAEPFPGKMPTENYEVGDIVHIPFVLAPRVINEMRVWNPKLTLIGCKMLVNATEEHLVEAALGVAHASKANMVIANDMGHGLRRKLLVYPDGSTTEHNDDFDSFYNDLLAVMEDKHWHTEFVPGDNRAIVGDHPEAMQVFDQVVNKYRDRFQARTGDTVYGSVLVPLAGGGYLASPRTKFHMFSAADAVYVAPYLKTKDRVVQVGKGAKATMNAPLMMRVAEWVQQHAQEGSCFAVGRPVVLHLHEHLPGVPTVPYGPPGTDRDNLRDIPGPAFNIEGHGFIACLNDDLEIPA